MQKFLSLLLAVTISAGVAAPFIVLSFNHDTLKTFNESKLNTRKSKINTKGISVDPATYSELKLTTATSITQNQFYVDNLKKALNYELTNRGYNEVGYLKKNQNYSMIIRIIDFAIQYAKGTITNPPSFYNLTQFDKVQVTFASSDQTVYSFNSGILNVKQTITDGTVFFGLNPQAYITTNINLNGTKATLFHLTLEKIL